MQKKNGITLKFRFGFRKNFGSQRCFLVMLETCKEAIDSSKDFGALLTDLLKDFDCLSHDLLIAKLHAFGLDLVSLNLQQDYLTNRKQKTKVNSVQDTFKSTARLNNRCSFLWYICVLHGLCLEDHPFY